MCQTFTTHSLQVSFHTVKPLCVYGVWTRAHGSSFLSRTMSTDSVINFAQRQKSKVWQGGWHRWGSGSALCYVLATQRFAQHSHMRARAFASWRRPLPFITSQPPSNTGYPMRPCLNYIYTCLCTCMWGCDRARTLVCVLSIPTRFKTKITGMEVVYLIITMLIVPMPRLMNVKYKINNGPLFTKSKGDKRTYLQYTRVCVCVCCVSDLRRHLLLLTNPTVFVHITLFVETVRLPFTSRYWVFHLSWRDITLALSVLPLTK